MTPNPSSVPATVHYLVSVFVVSVVVDSVLPVVAVGSPGVVSVPVVVVAGVTVEVVVVSVVVGATGVVTVLVVLVVVVVDSGPPQAANDTAIAIVVAAKDKSFKFKVITESISLFITWW
jgi:hypothetical protein